MAANADPHATAVFRVLQESLTNAARHASATTVEVTVERDAEAIMVKVRDNGRGFLRPQMIRAGSYGFTGMRERATLLGGTVTIDSGLGEGTLVVMHLPAPETEDTP